jgi:tetrahydromethanopterin S-methyltransferase subunit H
MGFVESEYVEPAGHAPGAALKSIIDNKEIDFMKKQKDMEDAMLTAHRQFVSSLEKSLQVIEQEFKEAEDMSNICTDEWCATTETIIDDMHKQVYSISEPRTATEEDSRKIKELRKKVKDLYTRFMRISAKAA